MIDLCTQGGGKEIFLWWLSPLAIIARTKTQEPKRYDGFLHAKLHETAEAIHWFSKEESTTAFFLSFFYSKMPSSLLIDNQSPISVSQKLWEKPFYQNGLLLLKWNYVMIGIWEQQQNICQKWFLWIFEVSF